MLKSSPPPVPGFTFMGRLVLKRSGPQGQIWYRGQVWSFGCKKMFQKHTVLFWHQKNHVNIHFSLKFTSAIWSDPGAICSDLMRSVNPILHGYIQLHFPTFPSSVHMFAICTYLKIQHIFTNDTLEPQTCLYPQSIWLGLVKRSLSFGLLSPTAFFHLDDQEK